MDELEHAEKDRTKQAYTEEQMQKDTKAGRDRGRTRQRKEETEAKIDRGTKRQRQ
jgi:hypothetical protein